MATSAGTRLAPASFIPDEEIHRRSIAAWEREAHQGHLGNVGSVTLTINVASTVVTDYRVGPNSVISFMPTTANASAEIGNGTIYVGTRGNKTFTITHANNAQADRTFAYSVLG